MQRDIRKELQKYEGDNVELSFNHSSKFESLLRSEMHQKRSKKQEYKWLSIAASFLLLIGLTVPFFLPANEVEDPTTTSTNTESAGKQISLGSISPEFKAIETYYVNSIHLEINKLFVTDQNRELLDDYLLKLEELNKEYKFLTTELNTKGVNDNTIDALISNLQLRLQLLKRLKKQLQQLENLNTKQNETQVI